MRSHKLLLSALLGAGLVASVTAFTGRAKSDDAVARGAAALYPKVPADQVEPYVSGDTIQAVAASGSMMAIWTTLEHGEAVECTSCIPAVEPLLYDKNPQIREIAAWWLRRRPFGVFGDGEVYDRTVKALESGTDAAKRAYAASALGEMLVLPAADVLATALAKDASPVVRAAAAAALGRMKSDGKGALGAALADGDASVREAALLAAGKVPSFSDATSVVSTLGSSDVGVRLKAAQLLGQMRAKDAVAALVKVAQSDADAGVRGAACHALGAIGDPAAQGALTSLSTGDPSTLVQDMARIALRRLG